VLEVVATAPAAKAPLHPIAPAPGLKSVTINNVHGGSSSSSSSSSSIAGGSNSNHEDGGNWRCWDTVSSSWVMGCAMRWYGAILSKPTRSYIWGGEGWCVCGAGGGRVGIQVYVSCHNGTAGSRATTAATTILTFKQKQQQQQQQQQ